MKSNRQIVLCRYQNDPLDRLVNCAPASQPAIRRYYLKDRLTTEIQGAIQRSIMQHDDQLLAQKEQEGSTTVKTALHATDRQRSGPNVLDATDPTLSPTRPTVIAHWEMVCSACSASTANGLIR